MPLQLISFFHFIFLLLAPLASSSSLTSKPGCPTRCGNLSIPYPFGVGLDCSFGASFNITCNTSTTPPKPYLNIDGKIVKVVEISLHPPQIRVKYPYLLVEACYEISTGKKRLWWDVIDLSKTLYTLSEDNWLTAMGCDDFVAATIFIGNHSFRDACIGFCASANYSGGVGSCPNNGDGNSVGNGCCRTPISKGTWFLGANLVDISHSWNRTRVFPCSYAFVKEKGDRNELGFLYDFSVLQDNSEAFRRLHQAKTNPSVVRLDWRIGTRNCSQVQGNSSFACRDNSHCVDFGANIGGYLCNCSEGYAGNPYLYQGCQGL